MSFLSRKYPWQERGPWIRDCALYCVVVFLILFFLQPFGFSMYGGNKLVASLLYGAVTFLCCLVYEWVVAGPLQKRVKPWRIWHQALTVLGLVLFIGLCNMVLYSIMCHYPIGPGLCLAFLQQNSQHRSYLLRRRREGLHPCSSWSYRWHDSYERC